MNWLARCVSFLASIDCPLQILLLKTPCQRKYPSQRSNNARAAFLGHTSSKMPEKKKNISTSPPTSVFYIYINVNCTHPFEIKMWNTKSLGRGAKVVGTLRPFCKLIRVLWDDAPAYEEAFPHQRERGPKRGIKLIYSEAEQGLQTIIQTLLINSVIIAYCFV